MPKYVKESSKKNREPYHQNNKWEGPRKARITPITSESFQALIAIDSKILEPILIHSVYLYNYSYISIPTSDSRNQHPTTAINILLLHN